MHSAVMIGSITRSSLCTSSRPANFLLLRTVRRLATPALDISINETAQLYVLLLSSWCYSQNFELKSSFKILAHSIGSSVWSFPLVFSFMRLHNTLETTSNVDRMVYCCLSQAAYQSQCYLPILFHFTQFNMMCTVYVFLV